MFPYVLTNTTGMTLLKVDQTSVVKTDDLTACSFVRAAAHLRDDDGTVWIDVRMKISRKKT